MSKMALRIAGHEFTGAIDDRCVGCGRTWAEIENATDEDVGKPDIAHIGSLNAEELRQIREERERRLEARERAWSAVVGVCAT